MAESLDDGEFWLPPQFLTDDNIFVEKETKPKSYESKLDGFYGSEIDGFGLFPFGSSRFSSDLSSLVESVVGSTETESDEDDFVSVLTQQMANSTLEDELGLVGFAAINAVSGGERLGLQEGVQPRMRVKEEESYKFNQNRALLTPNLDMAEIYYHQKLQAVRFQQMKQQNAAFWGAAQVQPGKPKHNPVVQNQNRARSGGNPLGLSPSAWPPLQPQVGSGMRAVFLGNWTGKKESTGTGVFLPRRHGAPTETRKKQASPTVLLPARVVQALNLNLYEIGGGQSQFQSRPSRHHPFQGDSSVRLRSGNGNGRLGSNFRAQQQQYQEMGQELRLPQVWTY